MSSHDESMFTPILVAGYILGNIVTIILVVMFVHSHQIQNDKDLELLGKVEEIKEVTKTINSISCTVKTNDEEYVVSDSSCSDLKTGQYLYENELGNREFKNKLINNSCD